VPEPLILWKKVYGPASRQRRSRARPLRRIIDTGLDGIDAFFRHPSIRLYGRLLKDH